LITTGIDIGSVATKAVVVRDGEIVGRSLLRSRAEPQATAREAVDAALAEAGVPQAGRVVATGYGRRAIDFADDVVTEITADARGAHHLGCPWGAPRLIVDLGGQDTKVLLLGESGRVRDFVMNDKCAAGTGRFLEVMAEALEVGVEELGALSQQSRHPVTISSTCTVFAESEVITHLAAGADRGEIIAGIHEAIAARVATMVGRIPVRDRVVLTGGVAHNAGVARMLEEKLGQPITVPEHAQLAGAIGAALIARD